jgi:hypothetical protein
MVTDDAPNNGEKEGPKDDTTTERAPLPLPNDIRPLEPNRRSPAEYPPQTEDTAAHIAADQRRSSAAVQSNPGSNDPPQEQPEHRAGAIIASTVGGGAAGDILPAPIPITPTVYPDGPAGTVIVQNHLTINIQSPEFQEFNAKVDDLMEALRGSNEITGE